jgi:hypothetical protein
VLWNRKAPATSRRRQLALAVVFTRKVANELRGPHPRRKHDASAWITVRSARVTRFLLKPVTVAPRTSSTRARASADWINGPGTRAEGAPDNRCAIDQDDAQSLGLCCAPVRRDPITQFERKLDAGEARSDHSVTGLERVSAIRASRRSKTIASD